MQMKFVLTLRADVDMTEHIHMRPRLDCAGESTGLLPAFPLASFSASVRGEEPWSYLAPSRENSEL